MEPKLLSQSWMAKRSFFISVITNQRFSPFINILIACLQKVFFHVLGYFIIGMESENFLLRERLCNTITCQDVTRGCTEQKIHQPWSDVDVFPTASKFECDIITCSGMPWSFPVTLTREWGGSIYDILNVGA